MILNKKQALDIASKFIASELCNKEWYQNCKEYVVGIILYGSVAKGSNRADSDIDILVVVPIDIETKYTTGEYFYLYEGTEINIVLRSVERMRMIAAEKKDLVQKEVFSEAVVLWSKDGEIESLVRDINSIRTSY